jgi:hypothetical protein
MDEENQDQTQAGIPMNVLVPPDHKPVFSNSVQVNVNAEEVTLQFLFVRPNTTQAILVSEIILTPQHAIRLKSALDDTIKRKFTDHLS